VAKPKSSKELGLKSTDKSKTKRKSVKKIKRKTKLAPIASKTKTEVKQYIHEKQKRANNPPVGLVTPNSDVDMPAKKYSFDPHLDPKLEWSGKTENSDFEVDTVSLHRHERIDPMTIIGKVMKNQGLQQQTLFPFFEQSENNLPLRDAIEFYKHDQGWSNRLIAGDSLLVMNSLLEKEGMENKVQMIYVDPPYGINYSSNFQPFVNKKNVKEGKDEDLTQEPEMVKAFRDTWELGIHSYLSQLRDRLLLAKKLLSETGSCFVQISEKNLHLVRIVMDEIFDPENFVSVITFRTKGILGMDGLASIADYLIWYAKDTSKVKIKKLYQTRTFGQDTQFTWLELPDGSRRKMSSEEKNNTSLIPKDARPFRLDNLVSTGRTESCVYNFEMDGKKFSPAGGRSWKTNKEGMEELIKKDRIMVPGKTPGYVFFIDDYPVQEITNVWIDTQGATDKKYVVQTSEKILQRCLLMTTDPGDLVLDPTCGSGTTAFIAEQFGRRWITCDSSRVSLTIAKQRLMTSIFDYYVLEHPEEGLDSGIKCKTVSHLTLGAIVHGKPAEQISLYDKPLVDNSKTRISGPFTMEAVPSPTVKSLDSEFQKSSELDYSISRISENKRQKDWRDELLITGVRGKRGQKIDFSRVETHPASQWIHAIAETKEQESKLVAVSFGPEYAPLEQRQVVLAISEAQKLVPKPELIIFASLQFDPEAAKDIDELQWPGVQVLKVQVNPDLFTSDLKKKRANNESFWLMGQPDVELKKQQDEKYIVEVKGFDYYNTKSGEIESGDSSKIAMWMLDTDYDERSLYPQQVFFPISSPTEGWSKLVKTLKSEIDEELIEHYSGTLSLPFSSGPNKQVAVKIIDDRGIESLKIIKIE